MPNPNLFNEEVGLLHRGWIDSYDAKTDRIFVKLNVGPITSNNPAIGMPAPHTMFFNNGMLITTMPSPGTPVTVAQGSGGQYHFVSFLAEDLTILPTLTLGEMLIQANDTTKITLNDSFDILLGSDGNRFHVNTDRSYISSNFDNEFNFTQAVRKVNGIVKRDLVLNTNFDQDSKLESDNYDAQFFVIGLDPTASSNSVITGSTKNPPFVEDRELVYEFQYDSNITDDLNESTLYSSTGTKTQSFSFPNRRTSRADTLSLTLASPNYLMETIKGTVVDIFGNILDLNRSPLLKSRSVNKNQATIRSDQNSNTVQSFLNIKAMERRSIAYHFEINARKDLSGSNGQISLPDINSNDDHARSRSRFFVDIDKEGQFKINVPASSETGNIPLLTRYENYSTFGSEDNNNPNKLIFRDDNLDIFQDSFAAPTATPSTTGFDYAPDKGSVQLKDGDADGAPIDRITGSHIKHGTAYHDILQTCYVHQSNDFINYQSGTTQPLTVDLSTIKPLTKIVSPVIMLSGTGANAGGRSGSMNFDGSVEVNIGANTIDRQSLWMDMAGGMVAHIGRGLADSNGSMRSAAVNMDGDFYMQIGGFGVTGDQRFAKEFNGSYGAVLDLRIMTATGNVHMFRCDNNGVTLMTPGNMAFHAAGDIKFTSDHNIILESETLIAQGRMILKEFGGSI
jgi:hypothetical protein